MIGAMTNQERASNTLKFRENATAGQWISQGTKIRIVVLAACVFAMWWVIYCNPDPLAIGAAGFFSGMIAEFMRMIFVQRRAIRSAWPFSELVTDWDLVNKLAGVQSVNPAATPATRPPDSN